MLPPQAVLSIRPGILIRQSQNRASMKVVVVRAVGALEHHQVITVLLS